MVRESRSHIDTVRKRSKKKKKIIDSRSRRLLFRRHANNSATSQRNRYKGLHESINPAYDACNQVSKQHRSRSEQFEDRSVLLARSNNKRR